MDNGLVHPRSLFNVPPRCRLATSGSNSARIQPNAGQTCSMCFEDAANLAESTSWVNVGLVSTEAVPSRSKSGLVSAQVGPAWANPGAIPARFTSRLTATDTHPENSRGPHSGTTMRNVTVRHPSTLVVESDSCRNLSGLGRIKPESGRNCANLGRAEAKLGRMKHKFRRARPTLDEEWSNPTRIWSKPTKLRSKPSRILPKPDEISPTSTHMCSSPEHNESERT